MAWRSLPAQRLARWRGGRGRWAGRKLTAIVAVAAMVMSLVTPVAAQATEPPARPTGLRLSAPSHDSVRLTWRNPGDSSITGYEISRRLGDSVTGFAVIVIDTGSRATSYEDTTVTAGTAYYYSIKARNAAGLSDPSNEMFDLYVRVPMAPNRSPVVTGNTAVIYAETESGTKTVASYRARSPDSNQFTWDVSGTDAGKFTITNGVLAFDSYPDYEVPTDTSRDNDYELTVRALDGQSKVGDLDVVVTVINVDEPPELSQTDPVVDEDAEKRTDVDDYAEDQTDDDVATYSARDPEGKDISWSLSGADRDDFTIDNDVLKFAAPPNFEAPTDSNRNNVYTVNVVASDGAKTASWSVTVTVKSVNEDGTVPLSSLQPVRDITLTATLSDPDVRLTDIEWQWEFQDGGTGSWADITGATSASFRPRQTDVDDRLRVQVDYVDSHGSRSLTSDETRPVQPPRSNNLRPVFSSQSFTRELDENPSSGQDVGGPVAATDEDTSSLTYRLSGADATAFTIDSTSAQIKTSAPLDYETKRTYRVNVVATDSSRASRSVAVTINVNNVEEPLSDVTGETLVDYAEDRTDAVATYTATDPDGTPVTWSLSGDDAGRFDISNRGVLSFAIRPDWDDPADQDGGNNYEVTVEASSGADDKSLSVIVMVTGIDEPLVLTGDKSVRFAENSSATDTVHTYEAADPEQGTAEQESVVWTLEGTDRELLTIVGGELKFKASPDYENPTDRGRNSSYDVTVVASNKRHTARQNVTVTVTNVDEAGALTLGSQQPQAGTALTATLTDPDARIRINSWRWHTSTDQSDWHVATGTGARSAKYTPGAGDAPPNGVYLRVTVTYTDAFGSKTLEFVTTRMVRAAPSTNSAPVFSSTDGRRSVDENTASGDDIGAAFGATDDDSGDTPSYSLRGTDAKSFAIDPSSGQLATRAALDHEAKNSYTVTVRVTDPSAAFDDVPVTIRVGNQEEAGTVTLSSVPPEVGTRLTATLTDPDGDISDLTWQWQRSTNRDSGWADIFAATSGTYIPTGAHANYYLRAVAAYTDGFSPSTLDTANGTTLEIVEMVRQQQRDTSTSSDDDDDDDTDGGSSRPTSSRPTSGGSGTSTTPRPDPEPQPADDEIFSDTDDAPSVHRAAVQTLSDEGVLDGTGCGDGRLCPEDHLSRWEMAVWLVRVVDDGADPLPTRRSQFADVDADEWWSPHVERLAELGITEGCKAEPLSYCPDQPVTRAQMASFLVRAFKLRRAGSAGFEDTAGNVHTRNIDAIYAAEITNGCAADPLSYCP